MDPIGQKALEMIATILVASAPGVVMQIFARRRERAEANKTDAEAQAELSDSALAWATEFRKDVATLRGELDAAHRQVEDLNRQLVEVRLINERLTAQVQVVETKNALLSSQVTNLERENESLRAELAQLRKEVGNGSSNR